MARSAVGQWRWKGDGLFEECTTQGRRRGRKELFLEECSSKNRIDTSGHLWTGVGGCGPVHCSLRLDTCAIAVGEMACMLHEATLDRTARGHEVLVCPLRRCR